MSNSKLYIPTPNEMISKLHINHIEQAIEILNTELLKELKTKCIIFGYIGKLSKDININLMNIFACYCYDDILYICKNLLDKYRAKGYIIGAKVNEEYDYDEILINQTLTIFQFEWNINSPPSYDDSVKKLQNVSNTEYKIITL